MTNHINAPQSYAEAAAHQQRKEQWQIVNTRRTSEGVTKGRPKFIFISTSNIKRILENKLEPIAEVTKVIRYILKETTDCVPSCNEHPNMIALHSLTNDLKQRSP